MSGKIDQQRDTLPLMDRRAAEANYSWDKPLKEIYSELARHEPDMPHYKKLALLAELKAGEAGEKTAQAVAGYTKWLMILTFAIAFGTLIQAIITRSRI